MESLKFAWQKMIASEKGPESPTTRHVLLTLSLFMDENGESCFPSTRTLATNTGLSRRSIEGHLRTAAAVGWVTRSVAGMNGQGWKLHSYRAAFPENMGNQIPHLIEKGGESGAKGGDSEGTKVGNDVPTISQLTVIEQSNSIISENVHSFLVHPTKAYFVL